MDLFDFIPFRSEFDKAYYGLTSNATHTSEKPVFDELKVRRFDLPAVTLTEFITSKIDHWIGWNLKSEKTTVGGMTSIRAQVNSFALLGMVIEVTFGLLEEKDISGKLFTTVNAKAETHIESKGDLGESRRVIRMMLSAMDHEFRTDRLSDEEYLFRTRNTRESAVAFQQIFDNSKLQHEKTPTGTPKSKPIEFKKKPVQTIQLKPAKTADASSSPAPQPVQPDQNNTHLKESAAETGNGEVKPLKPKITIISTKKTI